MRLHNLKELGDFIIDLFKETREEDLWEFYLYKVDGQTSFREFKKQQKEDEKAESLTEEQENEQMEFATQFVKPKKKEGE